MDLEAARLGPFRNLCRPPRGRLQASAGECSRSWRCPEMPSDAESLALAWLDSGGKRGSPSHPGPSHTTYSRHTTHQPHTAAGPREEKWLGLAARGAELMTLHYLIFLVRILPFPDFRLHAAFLLPDYPSDLMRRRRFTSLARSHVQYPRYANGPERQERRPSGGVDFQR